MRCNHLLGFTYEDEGISLVYGPGPWWKLRPLSKRDRLFKFCPFCGSEIEQPKEVPRRDA